MPSTTASRSVRTAHGGPFASPVRASGCAGPRSSTVADVQEESAIRRFGDSGDVCELQRATREAGHRDGTYTAAAPPPRSSPENRAISEVACMSTWATFRRENCRGIAWWLVTWRAN